MRSTRTGSGSSPDDPRDGRRAAVARAAREHRCDDPRSAATFRAYLADLTRDGYAYRFRHDDRPLADAEGSFLLCGFLVALTHHARGNAVEARSWYDTTHGDRPGATVQ